MTSQTEGGGRHTEWQYDENGLRKILEDNPFIDVLKTWSEQLEQFNNGKINKCQLRLLVDDGDVKLENSKKTNLQFHFELIPDVFRGDPRAPVWILLLNPGFSEIDLYDHLGLCPFCEKRLVVSHGLEVEHSHECVHAWLGAELDDPKAALRFRQEMMLKQLKLVLDEESCKYAWFDRSFRTIAPEKRTKLGKGGYWWWKEFLFGSERSNASYLLQECNINEDSAGLGRRFFAIDAFPYHSKNFDKGIFSQREYQDGPYFTFWKKLVEWALGSGRKLIVRYKIILDVLKNNIDKQILNASNDSIFWMPSLTPHLTRNNINIQRQNTKDTRLKALDELRAAWQQTTKVI